MERTLFGEDSSVEEEEEDSSEEEQSGASASGEQQVAGKQSSSSSSSSSSDSEEEETSPAAQPAPPVDPMALDEGGEEVEGMERKEEEEGEAVAAGDSQLPSTQDLFGGDSSSESDSESGSAGRTPEAPMASPIASPLGGEGRESGKGGGEGGGEEEGEGRSSPVENGQDASQTVEDLFGDAADITSSSSEDELPAMERAFSGEGVSQEMREEEGQEEVEREEVPRINVEIPRCVAQLGSDLHFVKLPNFLSVETRPFDPDLFEDEGEEDDILDEEGRARLKLKVENTIRWRYSQDEHGNDIRESNARIVRWSDGSMSLYLGSEIFDICRQPLAGEFSHLFVRQGTGLQGQAVFRTKVTFRPHSTNSQTHRKMTLSIADRFSKTQKIRVLPAVGKDPESQRSERIKKEEEKLRAAIRRENQQRRVRERHSQRGLTASYLEPDREEEEEEEEGGGVSVMAIKSSVRSRLARGYVEESEGSSKEEEEEEEEEEGEGEEEGEERLMRAKIEEALPRKHRAEGKERSSARKKPKKGRKLLLSDDEESD